MKISKHKLGLTFGLVTAFLHLVWVLAIVADVAERFLDWALSIHFMEFPYALIDPTFVGTIMLLALTFAAGYVIGWILALVWNWSGKRK